MASAVSDSQAVLDGEPASSRERSQEVLISAASPEQRRRFGLEAALTARPRRTRGVRFAASVTGAAGQHLHVEGLHEPERRRVEALVVLGVSPELGFDRALVAALYVAGVRPKRVPLGARTTRRRIDPQPLAGAIQPTERSRRLP